MPLIAEVGRKSLSSRLLLGAIYLILCIMGACMVIPFMITLSSSFSTAAEYWRFDVVPRFLFSREARYLRGLNQYFYRYAGALNQMKVVLADTPNYWNSWIIMGKDNEGVDEFANIYLEAAKKNPEGTARMAADYAEFAASYDLSDTVAFADNVLAIDFLMEHYSKKYLEENPDKPLSGRELRDAALVCLNDEWGTPYESFFGVNFTSVERMPLGFQTYFPPKGNMRYESYMLFLRSIQKLRPECGLAIPYSMRSSWYTFLTSEKLRLETGVDFDVQRYNAICGTKYDKLERTPFPIPASFPEEIQKLWRRFKRESFPLRLCTINVTPQLEDGFRKMIQADLRSISAVNKLLGTNYSSFEDIKLTSEPPRLYKDTKFQRLWVNYVKGIPVESRNFTSSEIKYQEFVIEKYGTLENVNKAYGKDYKYVEEIFPHFAEAYTQGFLNNQFYYTMYPAFKNFYMVMRYLLFNGNAVLVTLGLILLTLCFTLTINPLAAYALSRFNIKGHDKIILFMLATMAFPTMVSAIPSYLLMRDLGLLNTMWALVLPSAANGMSIFILKGFFDSLPQELFEAATIDGASEFQIFRIVAMPLVKPILAINCLTAFMHAYNGWEWALIICQKKSMWTIAVWLYQASIWWNGMPWIVAAGFIIASIPTLIVFISCQKIILRGIVIPTMK